MRSLWGEEINDLRPRPFNRAAARLPYLDNVWGLWLHRAENWLDWALLDYEAPYRCWISATAPDVDRAASESEFLDVPYPIAYALDEITYLRNLDVATIAVAHTTTTIGIRLDSSTLTPIYDPDEPIYVTNDGWQSWVAVTPMSTNVVYVPVTGSLELLYRDPSASVSYEFCPIENSFDVWGTFLGTKRLDEEGNLAYAQRLRTVMSGPVEATETGVAIDVARRIGVLRDVSWNYEEPYRQLILDIRDFGSGLEAADWCAVDHTMPTLATAGNGLRGTCWAFAGTGVLVTPATSYGGVDGFGISFWMRPDAITTATQTMLSYQGLNLAMVSEWLLVSVGTLMASVGTVGTASWYCVTLDDFGGLLRVGLNGTVLVSETNPWTLTYDTSPWAFGEGYTGRLDEIQASDGSLLSHATVANRIVPTCGYPVVVASPLGVIDSSTTVDEDLTPLGDTWMASHPVREPYEVTENGQIVTATVGTYTVTPATLSRKLDDRRVHLQYTVRWWYGNEGLVADQLPYGRYRVIVADGVTARSLSEYRELYLTTARGILTDSGYDLLKRLGEPLSWSRHWDETLYFYDSDPPMAPTPTVWDQDITYA